MDRGKLQDTSASAVHTREDLFTALYGAYVSPHLLFDPKGNLVASNKAGKQLLAKQRISAQQLAQLLPHQNYAALLNELTELAPEGLELNLDSLSSRGKLQRLLTPTLPLDQHLLFTVQPHGLAQKHAPSGFDFLARISIELKTPLNAILGFSDVMRSLAPRISQGEIEEFAAEIHKAGGHILSVVRYISDISQIESGQLKLRLETINCHLILDECLLQLQEQAERRNIHIIRAYEQSNLVIADQQRLKQVLVNLLSNAIKYNRDNGRITIRCAPTENGEFFISISDTGKGLKPEQLNHLFEPFNRLNASSWGIEGAGMGLAIARHLLEKMGGRIWADSQPNKGSTFHIALATPRQLPFTVLAKQ